MEAINVNGLVIAQTNYGEADRILHIFTDKLGIVSAIAKGARKYKSHQGSASQLLYYSAFTLVGGKGMYTLRGASTTESFFALSQDLDKLALCTYLFDITKALVPEGVAECEVLSLLLNTLYILKTKQRSLMLIKAAYELKLLALTGYSPEHDCCCLCGSVGEYAFFSPSNGGFVCGVCTQSADSVRISRASFDAVRYILENSTEKIYSFTLSDKALCELSAVCEKFVLFCAERDFASLSYLKTVLELSGTDTKNE